MLGEFENQLTVHTREREHQDVKGVKQVPAYTLVHKRFPHVVSIPLEYES